MRPLEGITVISIEQAVAAPFATRQLADLGARVIKVERPGVGDFARYYDTTVKGLSSHFVWLNRSKESLTLNLKHPTAREILRKLLARADVFIQNLAPGAIDRLGFGVPTLRERFPKLIVCSISGYGLDGPYRDKKAYDLLIQAESGLLSITGTVDAPSKVGIAVADIAAGMYAFTGVLTALYMRERTGQGAFVEVSMLEALGEWMGYPMYYTFYGGKAPARTGARHATIAPYGPFTTGDGSAVLIGIQNEREWERFCQNVLQKPELATDPRFHSNAKRVKHREVLEEMVQEVFRTLTTKELEERLEREQIAYGRMRTVEEFIEHPQLKARGRWRTVGSEVGELVALAPPTTIEGVDDVFGAIPAVGEHTEKILSELGYSGNDVRELERQGVVQ